MQNYQITKLQITIYKIANKIIHKLHVDVYKFQIDKLESFSI